MCRDTVKVPMADEKGLIWFTIRSRVYFNVTPKGYWRTGKKTNGIYKIAEEYKIEI